MHFLFNILFCFITRSIYPKSYKPIYLLPRGIDNPCYTSGCKYLFFVCRYCLLSVAWFSYCIHTLVSQLREIPTVVVLHHPFFFGEISTQFQATSKGISGAVAEETLSTSIRFLITNLISLQFTLFAICLSFSSPPLHKNLLFYSSSFLFAFFLPDLFLTAILSRSHNDSREHQVV